MAVKKHSSLDKVLGRLDQLDETNLHNLVQRLARERAMLEAVFNTLHEGVLVIEADGVVEYANEAAARLIGLKEPAVGETLWRLVPGLRESLADEQGEVPLLTREFELTYPAPRLVRLYMVPFSDGERGVRRHAIILSDITLERKSTTELIENEKISSI
ncbi:MAG TPA: PAS domain-containing protein, partial [Bacteroidia bacterium]|nr:PAS domain-containing protein [Bacteroidia bacterium]